MDDDIITIETPEHIQLHYELAGIGSRALAAIIDGLLQALVTTLVVTSLIWLASKLHWADAYGLAAAIIIASFGFIAATAYFVVSEMLMDGQSIGKRMAGLRVVRDDGTPITFLDSAIRNIVRVVDMLPLYTVGMVAVFFSSKCKRLGDMAAGTVVVKERVLQLPSGSAGDFGAEAPPLPVSPEAEARLRNCLHLLTPADLDAAGRFLSRRYELDADTRARLASRLAASLLSRLPLLSAEDFPQPEALLETVQRLHNDRPL